MKALLATAMILLSSHTQAQWWWSSTPDCDNSNVEDMVVRLMEHEFAKLQFGARGGFAMLGLRPSQLASIGQGFLDQILNSSEYGDALKEAAREVRAWENQIDLELAEIRRVTTNDETGATYCAATLMMVGIKGKQPYGLIRYVAQHTSEEQEGIYVEVTEY